MAYRLNKRPKTSLKLPQTHDDWYKLMQQALVLAEKTQDPRLTGLRNALATGQTEPHLRKLGIICMADLQREFPVSE